MTDKIITGHDRTIATQRRKIAKLTAELKEAERKIARLQRELEQAKAVAAGHAWQHLPRMGTTWD